MAAGKAALSVARTVDGGRTWQTAPVTPVNAEANLEIESAQLAIVDEQTLYLALKLPSSSSFSLGGLYASQDGGATWEARSLPLGRRWFSWTAAGVGLPAAQRETSSSAHWTAELPGKKWIYHWMIGSRLRSAYRSSTRERQDGCRLQRGTACRFTPPRMGGRRGGWMTAAH